MKLFIVTKEDPNYGSEYIGVFSTFDNAKAQVNIKCNTYKLDNTLNKLTKGLWATSATARFTLRVKIVTLDQKEQT